MLLTGMLRDLPGLVCHALLYWMVIKAIQSLQLCVKMTGHQIGHIDPSALFISPQGCALTLLLYDARSNVTEP